MTRQEPAVIDPHRNKERYDNWIASGQKLDIDPQDARVILEYLEDMAVGRHIGGQKGMRSPTRLNTIRSRMCVLSKIFRKETGKGLLNVSEDEIHEVFAKMRSGKIKKLWGKGTYKSTHEYVVSYKAFYHWYQRKIRRTKGKDLRDITVDLDTTKEKPKFLYLTFEDVKRLAEAAKPDYKAMIWLLFDSGIRAPTELMNVRKSDLSENDGVLNLVVREESSKTFGRKIKLLLCAGVLRQYTAHMKPDDVVFKKAPRIANQYLKRLATRVLGKEYAELTMYDFRHASACYWLPRYPNRSALLYRLGWKQERMIHYYTEFLGMKDTITSDDILDAEERTRLEAELEAQRKKTALLEEGMAQMRAQMDAQMRALDKVLEKKVLEKSRVRR